MVRHRAILMLLLLVFGPIGAVQAAPPVQPPTHLQRARKLADGIQRSVSKVRGLAIRRKLNVGVYDGPQLRAFVKKELTRGKAGKRLVHTGEALALLGLAPKGYDLKAGIVDLLEEQVAGLYDPRSKQLKLMKKLIRLRPVHPLREMLLGDPEEETRVVMAHEIVHALQDQHFKLGKMARERPHDADIELALSGLIEGDATIAMIAWMMVKTGQGNADQLFASAEAMVPLLRLLMKIATRGLLPDTASLARSPRWLQDRLTTPYIDGMQLCLQAGKRDGFRAIDKLFKRPPLSSEQLLHPERYLAKTPDWPQRVQLKRADRLPGRKWRLLWHDVLGELGARALFEPVLPGQSEQAADGWGGDRWFLWGRGDARAVAWVSTWDTDTDADEAEKAGKKWVSAAANRAIARNKRWVVFSATQGGGDATKLAQVALRAARAKVMTRLGAPSR